MRVLPCATIALLLTAAGTARADDTLDDADLLGSLVDVAAVGDLRLRSRLDASRDLQSPPLPAARFPLLARAGAQAAVAEHYSARVVAGAAGLIGAPEDGVQPFLDEAYIETRLPLAAGLARLRLGRQALELFGGRLVSQNSFTDRPPRLDSARLTAGVSVLELDAFVALLDGLPALADADPWAHRPAEDIYGGLSLSGRLGTLLALEGHLLGRWAGAAAAQDDPATELDERQPIRIATVGGHVELRPSDFVEAVVGLSYQLGEMRSLEDSADLAIGHEAIDLSLRLAIIGPWRGHPALRAGYDFTSGDRSDLDNRSDGFDAPLAEIHARYGAADMLRPRNAQDVFVAISAEEADSTLELSLHRLSLASVEAPWVDGSGDQRAGRVGGDERLLGHEIDLEGSLMLVDAVQIELLYAVFLPDGMARIQVGAVAAHRLLAGIRLAF